MIAHPTLFGLIRDIEADLKAAHDAVVARAAARKEATKEIGARLSCTRLLFDTGFGRKEERCRYLCCYPKKEVCDSSRGMTSM